MGRTGNAGRCAGGGGNKKPPPAKTTTGDCTLFLDPVCGDCLLSRQVKPAITAGRSSGFRIDLLPLAFPASVPVAVDGPLMGYQPFFEVSFPVTAAGPRPTFTGFPLGPRWGTCDE